MHLYLSYNWHLDLKLFTFTLWKNVKLTSNSFSYHFYSIEISALSQPAGLEHFLFQFVPPWVHAHAGTALISSKSKSSHGSVGLKLLKATLIMETCLYLNILKTL